MNWHKKPTGRELLLLLVSCFFSGALFLVFDRFYSAAVIRQNAKQAASSKTKAGNCIVPDPVRHHALEPNCNGVRHWGAAQYPLLTNNLGLRDESVRKVPLASARPRILMLGDSFTEGQSTWRDSYVGRIAAHLPQYEFLNGGVSSYSPSNYLNMVRMLLAAGVEFDELIVFFDTSDIQDEAAYYRDVDASGAVIGPAQESRATASLRLTQLRFRLMGKILTNRILEFCEKILVRSGFYHLIYRNPDAAGDIFDFERSAWTYRRVNEHLPFNDGYAPLGVEGGIAKAEAKMTMLWQELAPSHIPVSVVVYPWAGQVLHDTVDSREVRIWRDWCGGRCKRFISLFPAFLEAKVQCPRLAPGCWYLDYFIFGDVHYNAAGNALVADAAIQSLNASPPVKVYPGRDVP